MAQQAVSKGHREHSASGITTTSASSDLEGVPADVYGEQYSAHVLEQYKLYVQMADKISDRRQSANAFFLTLNTALITALAALISQHPISLPPAADAVVCWAGMILCLTWHRLISSYRHLNSGKFKVVHDIEKHLPLRPYDAEWTTVGRGKLPQLYRPFTHIETWIPAVFGAIYGAMLIIVLLFKR